MEGNKESKEQEQQKEQQQKEAAQELPTESSPYVNYGDLEDYKKRGYGTSGHQQPSDLPQHGVGTDAPTLSGSGLSESQVHETDPVKRQGVP